MSLHYHTCYTCEEEIVCSCDERRATDRGTGKARRILCLDCQNLEEMLKAALGDSPKLEKVN